MTIKNPSCPWQCPAVTGCASCTQCQSACAWPQGRALVKRLKGIFTAGPRVKSAKGHHAHTNNKPFPEASSHTTMSAAAEMPHQAHRSLRRLSCAHPRRGAHLKCWCLSFSPAGKCSQAPFTKGCPDCASINVWQIPLHLQLKDTHATMRHHWVHTGLKPVSDWGQYFLFFLSSHHYQDLLGNSVPMECCQGPSLMPGMPAPSLISSIFSSVIQLAAPQRRA